MASALVMAYGEGTTRVRRTADIDPWETISIRLVFSQTDGAIETALLLRGTIHWKAGLVLSWRANEFRFFG
jgi:hypothetical protein